MREASVGSALKEISGVFARNASITLQLESDRWTARAGCLDVLEPDEVYQHAVLVLERVEDEDSSVRAAAVSALLRSPAALARCSKLIALKLHSSDSRQIQLLALELMEEFDAVELGTHLKKLRPLLEDKDPAIRGMAKRLRDKVEHFHTQVSFSATASSAATSAPGTASTLSAVTPVQYRVGGRLVSLDASAVNTSVPGNAGGAAARGESAARGVSATRGVSAPRGVSGASRVAGGRAARR